MEEPPSGRAAATAGAGDTTGAVTIAERCYRWLAVIATPVIAIFPGLTLTQNSHSWLSRDHAPAAVAYLAVAAAASIWGCSRGWRLALRLDDQGVTIRNYLRTCRITWPEVRCFADGSVSNGDGGRMWALSVVLGDGRVITATATSRGKPTARPQTLTAIEQAAERYGIPAELTGGKKFAKIDQAAKAAVGLSETRDHRGSRARQVAWVVLPVVSLTILAWWPFLVLALIRRRARDWAMFAASLAALAAEITIITLATTTGVLPTAGVPPAVQALPLSTMILLLAVAGPVYILVAFRPTAAVPSLADAQRARAAAKRRRPAMDVGGPPYSTGAPAWAVGPPHPSEAPGGFPLPADVIYAEPPRRRRRIASLTAAGASVVAAVAATVVVLGGFAAHKPAAQQLTIDQLRAGDCLQGPSDINTARSWPDVVTAVPCLDKHLAEVYFFSANYWPVDMPFPGHARILQQASAECREEFRAYDGIPTSGSEFSFKDVSPRTGMDWSSGDRRLLCTAYFWQSSEPGGQALYGSIKGSDQ